MGPDQLAAVGATGSLSFFVLGFTFGLTGGYGIMVSQAFGAGDYVKMRKVVANAIVLSLMILVIFIPTSLFLAGPILRLMKTPDNIMQDAALYISIILGGTGCTMLYNVMSALLRAIGDTRTPLFFLILSSMLNIGLDLLFMVTFRWGVAGAALATILSQVVSGVLCMIYARKKYDVFRVGRAEMRPDGETIRQLLGLGIPMAFQSSLTAAGMLIMQASINSFGSVIIASYTISHKVEILVSMLALSLSTTVSTFVGQNFGAQKYDRMFRGVRIATAISSFYAAVSAAICFFAGVAILGLFLPEGAQDAPAVIEAGMLYLRTFACFLIPYNWLIVFRSALQGMGRSIYTLVGGSMECVIRILISTTLPGIIGYLGCCLAGPAAWIGAIIPLLVAYFYEKRKIIRK